MDEFSIEGFAGKLTALATDMPLLDAALLEHIGSSVTKAAKDKIGTYQAEAGQFEAWQSLAESTKEQRVREGFPEDEPGKRTGEMQDSIEYNVMIDEVQIGSNDDNLLWFELGTVKQPPRSVLGASVFEQAEKLVAEAGTKVEAFLAGGKI